MKRSKILSLVVLVTLLSCKSKNVVQAVDAKQSKNPVAETVTQEVLKAPAFFTADHDDHSWSLSISSESIVLKIGENADEFVFPYHNPLRANQAKLRLFRSNLNVNAIEITVTNQPCGTNVETEAYKYEVFIKLAQNGKVTDLSGCGIFSADKSLNRVWTLQQLNGKMMTPENFGQELPYIDIHSEIGSFTGFGGCNRNKGKVGLFEPGSIQFSDIIETKMICIEGNQESDFMRALHAATNYEVKNNLLYLYNEANLLLILKK